MVRLGSKKAPPLQGFFNQSITKTSGLLEHRKYSTMKGKPHPKVIQRKLGREKADGLYCDNIIEIDPTLPPMRYLIVLIHEYLHHIQPEWSEEKVDAEGEALGRFLWKQGYRKVQQ
jgi:hypothetical protein